MPRISLPSIPGLRASSIIACSTAPEEMPTGTPSSRATARAAAKASRSATRSTPSRLASSSTTGQWSDTARRALGYFGGDAGSDEPNAPIGTFRVSTNSYRSDRIDPNGKPRLHLRLIRDFGRPTEREDAIDLEMGGEVKTSEISRVTIGARR